MVSNHRSQALLDDRHPVLNASAAWQLIRRSALNALANNADQQTSTDASFTAIGERMLCSDQHVAGNRAERVIDEHLSGITDYWQQIEATIATATVSAASVAQLLVDAVQAELGTAADDNEWIQHCMRELRLAALRPYERCDEELSEKRLRFLADAWYMHGELRRLDEVIRRRGDAHGEWQEQFGVLYTLAWGPMLRATVDAYWSEVNTLSDEAVARMLQLTRSVLLLNATGVCE